MPHILSSMIQGCSSPLVVKYRLVLFRYDSLIVLIFPIVKAYDKS